MVYITQNDMADVIAEDERLAGKSPASLELLISASKELIDDYCNKEFMEPIPAIVKVVNMELVRAMAADPTKQSESVKDYTYQANKDAYKQILSKLSHLVVHSDPPDELPAGKKLRASLI